MNHNEALSSICFYVGGGKLEIGHGTVSNKITKLKLICKKLASNDSDPIIRKFCMIVFNEPIFFEMARDIFYKRPLLNEEHSIFLLFVSLQYFTKFSYDEIDQITEKKVKSDLNKFRQKLQEICLKYNVSTNIPERYIGLQIISSIEYSIKKKPLTVIDLGCSLGLGLNALNTDFFEKKIEIQEKLLPYVKSKPVFDKIIGIDIQNPDLDWVMASYLPETKEKRQLLKGVYKYLSKQHDLDVEVIQGDALHVEEMTQLSSGMADIVWISNTCYQVEGDVEDVIKGIGWLLKEGGLWLYAYYRHGIDEKITPKLNPFVVTAYKKDKTWVQKICKGLQSFRQDGLEVLEAPDESVLKIYPGRNYRKFITSMI